MCVCVCVCMCVYNHYLAKIAHHSEIFIIVVLSKW